MKKFIELILKYAQIVFIALAILSMVMPFSGQIRLAGLISGLWGYLLWSSLIVRAVLSEPSFWLWKVLKWIFVLVLGVLLIIGFAFNVFAALGLDIKNLTNFARIM